MRAFVALELGPEPRIAVAAAQRELAEARDFRPTSPERCHVTLKFLGEIDAARRARIESALAEIRVAPFELRLRGRGAFPSPGRPRVVWIGLEAAPELAELAAAVERATAEVAADKPFAPHVTIARASSPSARIGRAFLERPTPSCPWRVDEFVLYRSTLAPSGAAHEVLRRFPLRGDAAPRHR